MPQNFLKQCLIENEVDIEVKDNTIVIVPISEKKRVGWADAFKEMAQNGDDELIIPSVFDDEGLSDWSWK